jgi:hypothetical protein
MQYKIMGDSTFSNHHPVSFQIDLVKMPQETHGKPMEDPFMRPRNQLGQYVKPPLHKCNSSLNYRE